MMKPDTRSALAAALLVLVLLAGLALVFKPIPMGNENSFNLLLGGLIAWAGAVVGWFFGSSKGSATKDDTIASLSAK